MIAFCLKKIIKMHFIYSRSCQQPDFLSKIKSGLYWYAILMLGTWPERFDLGYIDAHVRTWLDCAMIDICLPSIWHDDFFCVPAAVGWQCKKGAITIKSVNYLISCMPRVYLKM